jgi:hypothetical protein
MLFVATMETLSTMITKAVEGTVWESGLNISPTEAIDLRGRCGDVPETGE